MLRDVELSSARNFVLRVTRDLRWLLPCYPMTMTSTPTSSSILADNTDSGTKELFLPSEDTFILHRTPWVPPTAVSARGIYITLEDGREVIDGCGGAAVACIGHGHSAPEKAIKEQVEKMSCKVS